MGYYYSMVVKFAFYASLFCFVAVLSWFSYILAIASDEDED